ncbi:hypothetical protein E4T56_gene2893 [Termitomyces sp. T112]|nr:hypothetical protein E4T56_gene2893 [Termitomyces sp. T112]KAH0590717.1 hypothetical protein H2248_000844 [Termitomyces sp. 'cryptogamus']
MTRMILIALHAAVITTLTQTTSRAVAAPLPLPTTVYLRSVLSPRNVSRPFPPNMRFIRNVTSSVPTSPLVYARAISSEAEFIKSAAPSTENSTADSYIQLVNFHQATKQNAKNLKKLAAQSASSKANDVAFQRKCVAQLNAFHSNILRQQAAFSAFADEKHQTISSRSEDRVLEELLKGVVTTCKDGLKYSEELVKNIPILGPIFAPIVYDVKCYLDDVLNYIRDVLIYILKGLPPDIANLLGA